MVLSSHGRQQSKEANRRWTEKINTLRVQWRTRMTNAATEDAKISWPVQGEKKKRRGGGELRKELARNVFFVKGPRSLLLSPPIVFFLLFFSFCEL